MKKTLLLAGLALLLPGACTKYVLDEDSYGGSLYAGTNPVQTYMTDLFDTVVAGSLENLEEALRADGQSTAARLSYVTDGHASLEEDGSKWVLARESNLKGLVMEKAGDNTWRMSFDGEFLSGQGKRFPTKFALEAIREQGFNIHGDWRVSLSIVREEEDGYVSSFSCEKPVSFRALASEGRWYAYGDLLMTVTKNGHVVDEAVLTLRGPKGDALFAHTFK